MAKEVLSLPEGGRRQSCGRRAPKKVPSFHLTGAETMKFIKEANIRAKEKEAKQKEKEEIKKLKNRKGNKNESSYPLDMSKWVMMFGHVTTFQDIMPKKLNHLIDVDINDLLDVYNGNEIIIVNIILAVFICYLLLKQWLPAIETP